MEIENLKFDENGLIPAIIQDAETKTVLMLGYMNREALTLTLTNGKVCFSSRSWQELLTKGEESVQILQSFAMSLKKTLSQETVSA